MLDHWQPQWLPSCRCYAAALDKETQFGLHRGAHSLECPVYRPSIDPVDAANDEELRTHYTDFIRRLNHARL